MGEELYEHETETMMTREQAAARLRALADQLERHNEVRVNHGDREVSVRVADQVGFEFEVEVEPGGKNEIEVTISW
ncbi:amphi-Trp domain-containing protein [Propioniferax innocua]|uniref:Amphi-Trp domain-containing protein n=1 Tax=Propioniferax innocua TaxID=1753 RepID=A0A542ZS92_9ACTN|nr:amphi-Trp domain-containing protein [Propioniferax innocua]TQL63223.1 amphi-Trp domain-containing protein [Propioniferax innocua]